MDVITGAVGQGGTNQVTNVWVVQRLLNDWLVRNGKPTLNVDGVAGPKTIEAITTFQRTNSLRPDGRVDAGGPTINALFTQHLSALLRGISGYGLARYVDTSVITEEALSDPTVKHAVQTYVGVLRKSA